MSLEQVADRRRNLVAAANGLTCLEVAGKLADAAMQPAGRPRMPMLDGVAAGQLRRSEITCRCREIASATSVAGSTADFSECIRTVAKAYAQLMPVRRGGKPFTLAAVWAPHMVQLRAPSAPDRSN